MWVIEWTQPGQNRIGISLVDNQQVALASACEIIMETIHKLWDLGDPDQNAAAHTISDECARMKFQAAIDCFNEWEADGDYEFAQRYRVYERPVSTKMPHIRLLGINHTYTTPASPPVKVATVFKATVAGATCRGPCGNYNEYAYADKPDGTHCCFQCKYMSEVFGVKNT